MPYKTVGNKVMVFKNGKWSVKQVAKSAGNAKDAIRLLQAIEHNPDFKLRKRKK